MIWLLVAAGWIYNARTIKRIAQLKRKVEEA
jgi:hypothetical protein